MDIWKCALGFMDSQALLTAEEIGVFNCLERQPMNAEEIASHLEISVDSAERLLDFLSGLDIIEKDNNGNYRNSNEASKLLVRGKPGYIGDLFVHLREDLYPLWGTLKKALETGGTIKKQKTERKNNRPHPEKIRAFTLGMHTLTYQNGIEFAENAPELESVETIVDVGGAGGSFLIACAQKFPQLKGTVADLDYVQPVAEELFRKYDLQERLNFTSVNFFADPLPKNADAYMLGYILHDWTYEEGSVILSKISGAAPTNSLLLIGEYLLTSDKTGPLHVARANMNMLVAARGKERTAEEYRRWIDKFGFSLERIQMTKSLRAFLIARKR